MRPPSQQKNRSMDSISSRSSDVPLYPISSISSRPSSTNSAYSTPKQDESDGGTPRKKDKWRRTKEIRKVASERFATKHKWLSIYFSPRVENLPRVVRVTILLCMVLTNMAVASVFYNKSNRSTAGQKIVVGVIGSCISFVLSFLILTMFRRVQKRLRPACYLFSFTYIAGTVLLTLWYNLSLDESSAYAWCLSACIGIIQDGLVNEPLKILLISTLVAVFPAVSFLKKL